MEKVKQLFMGKITRKIYWLPADMIERVEKEAARKKLPNDSVLVRHIVHNWFAK